MPSKNEPTNNKLKWKLRRLEQMGARIQETLFDQLIRELQNAFELVLMIESPENQTYPPTDINIMTFGPDSVKIRVHVQSYEEWIDEISVDFYDDVKTMAADGIFGAILFLNCKLKTSDDEDLRIRDGVRTIQVGNWQIYKLKEAIITLIAEYKVRKELRKHNIPEQDVQKEQEPIREISETIAKNNVMSNIGPQTRSKRRIHDDRNNSNNSKKMKKK